MLRWLLLPSWQSCARQRRRCSARWWRPRPPLPRCSSGGGSWRGGGPSCSTSWGRQRASLLLPGGFLLWLLLSCAHTPCLVYQPALKPFCPFCCCSSRRARLPELESTKRAAVAARDFKAAGDAAAEAKAAAAEAEDAEQRAAALKQSSAAVEAEEQQLAQQAGEAEAAVAEASAAAAKARWRGLLGAQGELQKQLARAGPEGSSTAGIDTGKPAAVARRGALGIAVRVWCKLAPPRLAFAATQYASMAPSPCSCCRLTAR